MSWWRSALSILAVAALAIACGKADSPGAGPSMTSDGRVGERKGAGRAEARIYAAASLSDVIGALAKDFEPIRGSHVVASYGASSTLAQQLKEGAPPGVFVSASPEWVDRLEEAGKVEEGTRIDLLSNSLVVVVPAGAAWRPSKLEDLAAAEVKRLTLADPEHVPAGRYAKAALEKLLVFEGVRTRIVAAQDVRTALAYVERGEAEAGIVYATDAATSSKVNVALRVPSELHPRIVYPMVVVQGANRRAHELYEFLKSDRAWPAFAKAGFRRP